MSSLMTYGIFFPSQVLETFSEVLTITKKFSPSLVQYFLYEIRRFFGIGSKDCYSGQAD